jgi:hypothetical protein
VDYSFPRLGLFDLEKTPTFDDIVGVFYFLDIFFALLTFETKITKNQNISEKNQKYF